MNQGVRRQSSRGQHVADPVHEGIVARHAGARYQYGHAAMPAIHQILGQEPAALAIIQINRGDRQIRGIE